MMRPLAESSSVDTRGMPMGIVRTLFPWLLLAVVMSAGVISAQGDPATAAARAWRVQHERAILDEFMRFLAIPNVTTDRDGISRNAAALGAMLRARGISPQLLSVSGANPVVFGEIRTPGDTRTL